jgi:iron complex outermembrane receptor protein
MHFMTRIAAIACLIASGAVGGQTAPSVRFSIPAQSLQSALLVFSQQAGVQVVVANDVVKGINSPALEGEYSATAALARLLEGSGLTYRVTDERTIAIQPLGSADGAKSTATEDGGADQLEEIIVTAQKREEKLIDVPISIVALNSDELRKRKITSLDDLQMTVPGLAMQSTGTWQRRIVLRGISNMFGSSSSLIGMYLDEAAITSRSDMQPHVSTYDLERVEVLRGPQGTLYGEGSVGGTLRFITRNPQLDAFGLTANVSALYTVDGGPGQRVESAVNIPLIQDRLGVRVAGTFDRQSGWIDQPAAEREDINDQDLMNVRIKTLWQPTEQFSVNVMALIHRNQAGPNIGESDDGDYTQKYGQTTQPIVDDRYNLFNLALTYDFNGASLLSNTAYLDQSKDAQFLGFVFPILGPPPTAPLEFYTSQYYNAAILTQELRLTSNDTGPWKWTLGGFYRDYDTDYGSPNGSRIGVQGSPLPTPYTFGGRDTSKAWALFGDANYAVTDRLTLGAGVRKFKEDQESWATIDTSDVPLGGSFDSTNPRLYGQFKLAEGVNTYASAAKGFRSGGFNPEAEDYDPEEVWTYELGLKTSLLGGRLQTDAAIFHSDYKNFQIIGILPSSFDSITSNAGDVRVRGVEWSVSWYPSKQWDFSFNGNYVDTEFVEISASSSTHIVGDPLDLTPKYSFNLSTQRNFGLRGRTGFARLDYNHVARSTFRNRTFGYWFNSESDIINMLNLNTSVQWSDSLALNFFAQNLLNDRGNVNPWEVQGSASRSRPRTYGIGFDVSLN